MVTKVVLDDTRIKRIHVNKHVIAANRKYNRNNPPLSCKVGKDNFYGFDIEIKGPGRVVYSPDKPLKCGAWVWIETNAPVEIE